MVSVDLDMRGKVNLDMRGIVDLEMRGEGRPRDARYGRNTYKEVRQHIKRYQYKPLL